MRLCRVAASAAHHCRSTPLCRLAFPIAFVNLLSFILLTMPAEANCPKWVHDVQGTDYGSDSLVGVGSARGEGPGPANSARQRAVSAIAEQIRVQVQSSVKAEDQAYVRNGVSTETQRVQAMVQTDTNLVLEGAETKESCSEDGSTHVLVVLDRKLFLADARQRLQQRGAELRKLEAKARQLQAEGRWLDAASSYEEAAANAEVVDENASFVRIVGKSNLELTHTPGIELRRFAREMTARTTALVRVTPSEGTEVIRRLAMNCVTRAGLATAETASAPDAVLALDVQMETPNLAMGSLYIVRATMTAVLEPKAGEPIKAGSTIQVKGGGTSAEASVQDALRRLGSDKLGSVIDDLFASGGWRLKHCSSNRK